MKKIIIVVCILAAVVLAVKLSTNSGKERQRVAEVAEQKAVLSDRERELKEAQSNQKRLQADLERLGGRLQQQEVLAQAMTNRVETPLVTNAPVARATPLLGKMMEDPEMKKMMIEQQKQAFRGIYRKLTDKLALSPEQNDEFLRLVSSNHTASLEMGTKLMADLDQPGAKERIASIFAQRKAEFDEQLKTVLGAEKLADFEDYSHQMGHHMMLESFKGQVASSGEPLKREQYNQLITSMQEVTAEVSTEAGLGADGHAKASQDWTNILFEDSLNQIFDRQLVINERVAKRAEAILTPEQREAFSKHQANMMKVQRTQLDMARRMMGAPERNAAAP